MRCMLYSSCSEPKHLCCNFCSNTKCEIRCKDNCKKCKYYEHGEVEIENKSNHVIKKKVIEEVPTIVKGRGRPKKEVLISTESIKKGRGRPKKETLIQQ